MSLNVNIYLNPVAFDAVRDTLTANRPHFDYTVERFFYLVGLPTYIAFTNKDSVEDGYVPVLAEILQTIIGDDYRLYRDYLLSNDILQDEGKGFVVHKRATGYRLHPRLYTTEPTVRVSLAGDQLLCKRLLANRSKRGKGKTYDWLKENLSDLTFDGEKAYADLRKRNEENMLDFLKQMPENTKVKKTNPTYKFEQAHTAFMYLKHADFIPYVDDAGYRFYTALTSLPKWARRYVGHQGKTLHAIDIKNSQPFFLCHLLSLGFWFTPLARSLWTKSSRDKVVALLQSWYKDNGISDGDLVRAHILPESTQTHVPPEFQTFENATCEGRFYEHFQDLSEASTGTRPTRDEAKNAFMVTLFSTNSYVGGSAAKPKRIFRTAFPKLNEFITLLKSKSRMKPVRKRRVKRKDKRKKPVVVDKTHTALCLALQRIESTIVLEKVARRVCRERFDIPFYTIHDSVVTTGEHVAYVKRVMEDEIRKYTGLTPMFEVEAWV